MLENNTERARNVVYKNEKWEKWEARNKYIDVIQVKDTYLIKLTLKLCCTARNCANYA